MRFATVFFDFNTKLYVAGELLRRRNGVAVNLDVRGKMPPKKDVVRMKLALKRSFPWKKR